MNEFIHMAKFTNLEIVLSSFSGAFVYSLCQYNFKRKYKFALFFLSFVMGVIGADATLVLVREFIPSDISGERAVGAFICSSLVVTVIVRIIHYLDVKTK